MSEILNVRTPSDFSRFHGVEPKHPLVGVIEYAEISPIRSSLNRYDVYGLFMHTNLELPLRYGCGSYGHSGGTLICVAPGQIGGADDDGLIELNGWSLLFHPDLLRGTPLESGIHSYPFFDYNVNEALRLTEDEQNALTELVRRIQAELANRPDPQQNLILVNLIEAVLNYCRRFYNRQALSIPRSGTDILARLENVMKRYYIDGVQHTRGLPTVAYCADRLGLTANYLGDVVKRGTGETVSRYIRRVIIQKAKNDLASGKSVAETAYALGFGYPQHLTRMFKREEGISPGDFVRRVKEGQTGLL